MFTPDDYAGIVPPSTGAHGDPTKLDAEDLIAFFSDGTDDDGNGFVDDIAGWDFFDDDNDPFDASSYSSANNHGSGRASDAVAEGNNRLSGIGLCPQCRLVPIRVWDTFVVDNNNFALCLLYAADNGIDVTEAALGALTTTEFAQAAGAAGLLMSYGKQRGTPLTANEVKQILTLTADDVLPGDTLGTGDPDPSQPGWDQHFGYGRVNLRTALVRLGVPALDIAAKIPPEATLERPPWFQVLDPDLDNDGR